MSTENSSDQLFNNSIKILTDSIGFKTKQHSNKGRRQG